MNPYEYYTHTPLSDELLKLRAIEKRVFDIMREYHISAIEHLTCEQTANAIAQAIAAGDFQRHIMVDSGDSSLLHQSVVYIPYREVERLKSEVEELKRMIIEMKLREVENRIIRG